MILTLQADEVADNNSTMIDSISPFDAGGLVVSPRLRGDEDDDFDDDDDEENDR